MPRERKLLNTEIRTDPTCSSTVAFVHPTQIDPGPPGGAGGALVAIGTYKCKGSPPDSCPDDFDAYWNLYVDWEVGGIYQCFLIAADAYGTGNNPTFQITQALCNGIYSWNMYFSGFLRKCLNTGTYLGSGVAVGIETTNTTLDKNIDVKYTNLIRNLIGTSTWSNFGGCPVPPSLRSPNYAVATVSGTACNTCMPPLD